MSRTLFLMVGMLMVSLPIIHSCSSANKTGTTANDSVDDTKTIAMRNNHFAFEIFSQIERTQSENLLISPFSISTALAMTYPGARGETATQIGKTLHFAADQNTFSADFTNWTNELMEKGRTKNQLQIANSLWPQKNYPFHESYIELINTYFQSKMHPVDYMGDRETIRQQINEWVAENTNNLIRELIKPGILVEDTRLVLVNAIYFLSAWKTAFDKQATHPAVFHISPERNVETAFMYMKDKLMYYEEENFQLLELPYEGADFSMLLFLPAPNTNLSRLISNFDANKWEALSRQLAEEEVEVFLPSFRVRSQLDLEDLLSMMGMPLAFSDKADFSAMTPLNDLKIDKVIHEAYIDIKEEGTEAAASTAVVMIRKTAIIEDPKPVFRANRPFFYVIRENASNSILFMGKTINPAVRAE